MPWFDSLEIHNQTKLQLTSKSTNTIDKESEDCIVYNPDKKLLDRLPYPSIRDDTEGIPAFKSLLPMMPKDVDVILDIGGGSFDTCKQYVETKLSKALNRKVIMYVVDPFNRSEEHNECVEKIIVGRGGADVVTSISVLNVIPNHLSRIEHIRVVHDALRKDGLAMFKVWAGSWPFRGTKNATTDKSRQCYQANTWASDFVSTVRQVFGPDAPLFACNVSNLIVVRRISTSNIEFSRTT